MCFTTEQLNIIKNKIKELEIRRDQLEKDNNSNSKELLALANELRKYINMISNPVKYDDSIVNNTRFNATIEYLGYKENNDYLLSDEAIYPTGYITIKSITPLAKAILGKHKNDTFIYEVNGTTITGIINNIYTNNYIEKHDDKVYTKKTIEK